MKIKNIRNLEILNENPKVLYAEADYIGATELQNVYGFVYEIDNEKVNIFNVNASLKLKEIFKKSCIEHALNPRQYDVKRKAGVN